MSSVTIPSIIIIIYCGLCPETIKNIKSNATEQRSMQKFEHHRFCWFSVIRICGLIKCCISISFWTCFHSVGRLSVVSKTAIKKKNQRWHDFSHFVLRNKNMRFNFFFLFPFEILRTRIPSNNFVWSSLFPLTFRSAHQLFIIFCSKFVWFSWILISVFALPSRTNFRSAFFVVVIQARFVFVSWGMFH